MALTFEGFSGTGILLEDSSSSAIYNRIVDSSSWHNGTALWLDQHNSGKSVNANAFDNDQFVASTGTINVRETGAANENVFESVDVSEGSGAAGLVGFQTDSGSGRDTVINGMTAEGLGTIFKLAANTPDFCASGVDGGFFNGSNGTSLNADPTATYEVCWGALGNTAQECDSQLIHRTNYSESTTVQDPTGQVGLGQITNLLQQSEALATSPWTAVSGLTATDNAVTAPNGQTTADKVVLSSGANAILRQSYSYGSSIQNHCFTGAVWMRLDPNNTQTPHRTGQCE